MPRVKRAQVTTEAPAQPATATPAAKTNGKNGQNGITAFDLESAIRVRAYELYEKRGRQDGNAQTDWFQAEAEVRSRGSRTA